MKTIAWIKKAILLLVVVAMGTACTTEPIDYDRMLLLGTWQSAVFKEIPELNDDGDPILDANGDEKMTKGYDHQKYNSDGTGTTWDTSDYVKEEEAQKFTWTLEVDVLTHIHITEMSADGTRVIPKVYTVKELTKEKLTYMDDYGNLVMFNKLN